MTFFIILFLVVVLFEILLRLIVRLQHRVFPWLITERDDLPVIDPAALNKFIDYSFDPELGWVRKPNSSGVESGRLADVKFHIDETGSRVSVMAGVAPLMAAYGDSYVFCRQVADDETWESQLAVMQGFGVLNFGVGNYGADQALLRYEREQLPVSVKYVILGFVPETICRVQSCWKHYLEFGNTFAFKPRFILNKDGELMLIENPMRSMEDFSRISDKLTQIRSVDRFYHDKFRYFQFRSPYLLRFLRHPLRHSQLMASIALRSLLRICGFSSSWSENLPFSLVMAENVRNANRLYTENKSINLLMAIFLRFRAVAESRGHIPLLLVMPQLLDLKSSPEGVLPRLQFFEKLQKVIPVIDFHSIFVCKDHASLYINDQYGGHLSAEGNRVVADEISNWLNKFDGCK